MCSQSTKMQLNVWRLRLVKHIVMQKLRNLVGINSVNLWKKKTNIGLSDILE